MFRISHSYCVPIFLFCHFVWLSLLVITSNLIYLAYVIFLPFLFWRWHPSNDITDIFTLYYSWFLFPDCLSIYARSLVLGKKQRHLMKKKCRSWFSLLYLFCLSSKEQNIIIWKYIFYCSWHCTCQPFIMSWHHILTPNL